MQLEAISPGPVSPVATSRFQTHLDYKCRVEEGIWLKVKIAKSVVKLSLASLIVRISQSEFPSQPHSHLTVTIWANCVGILTTSSKTDGQTTSGRCQQIGPSNSLNLFGFGFLLCNVELFSLIPSAVKKWRSGCYDVIPWYRSAVARDAQLAFRVCGFPIGPFKPDAERKHSKILKGSKKFRRQKKKNCVLNIWRHFFLVIILQTKYSTSINKVFPWCGGLWLLNSK